MEIQTYIANERIIRAKRIKHIQRSSDILLIANQVAGRYYLKNVTWILGLGYRYITEVVYIDEFNQTVATFTYDVQRIQSVKQWKKFMERYRLESGKIIKGRIRWFHPINVGDYLFRLHQAHLPEDKEFRDAITWANANGYRYVYSIEYKELPLFSHDLIKVYDFSNERYFIKKDWGKESWNLN